jgi:hypothetical protein
MIINGAEYEVRYIMLDGPLEAKNVLLVVYADIQEKKA